MSSSKVIKDPIEAYRRDIMLNAFGSLVGGAIFLIVAGEIAGYSSSPYPKLALFGWLWIRLISLFREKFRAWNATEEMAWGLSGLLVIVSLATVGFLRKEIPMDLMVWIAAIDVILYLLSLNVDYKAVKNIVYGLMAAVAMDMIIAADHFPWLTLTAQAGIGSVDDFRDAAILNAWRIYGVFSYGVHGLMYEPYHPLSTLILASFISSEVDVFAIYAGMSYIVIPAMLIFGVQNIMSMLARNRRARYWIICSVIFIYAYSAFFYVANQRSVQAATLVFIFIIPLLHCVWLNRCQSSASAALLAITAPLLVVARPFHGLYYSVCLCAALLGLPAKNKIVILFGLICACLIVFMYYGDLDRAAGINYYNLILVFFSQPNGGVRPWVLALLSFIVGAALIKDPVDVGRIKVMRMLMVSASVPFLLAMKAHGYSDIYYQMLPAFWFVFLVLFSDDVVKIFPCLTYNVSSREARSLLAAGVFLIAGTYLESLGSVYYDLKSNVIQIRSMVGQWNPRGGNSMLLDSSRIQHGDELNWLEIFRYKIFGSSDLKTKLSESPAAKMRVQAMALASGHSGVTAVYVAPDHEYWKSVFPLSLDKASLFFMATSGMPIVKGAHPDLNTTDFSISKAHRSGGTLGNINLSDGGREFCNQVDLVQVANIIIFEDSSRKPFLIACRV